MPKIPSILADAPLGRHICQFHRTPQGLTEAVAGYVDVGLYRRDGVVVIAEAGRRANVLRRLAVSGIDTASAIATGQLVLLDAEATLGRFCAGDMPQEKAFREAISPVLDTVLERGFRQIRAYGEMVNVLWRAGRYDAALRLEHLWNELIAEYPLALFCGYEIDGLDPRAYSQPLDAVARAHSDVVRSDDDERLQAAVDSATTELLGLPLSTALTYFGDERSGSEHRLPPGHRTLLWLNRNMPSSMVKVLSRARAHYSAPS